MSITTGAIFSSTTVAAASMPSFLGIFTSMMTRSGSQLAGLLDRGLAVGRLTGDDVALLGEHLGEVHADQRLVLDDQDPPPGARTVAVDLRRVGNCGNVLGQLVSSEE